MSGEQLRRHRPLFDIVNAHARRLWALPLWCHALALLIVLAITGALTAPAGRLYIDEGLAIIQVQNLSAGHGWSLPWAFADVDPTGEGFGIPVQSPNFVVYGKHPLYLLVLTGLYRIGGVWAMVGFSMIGTMLAALGGAWLARLMGSRHTRWVFWLTGLGTPLIFDGLLIVAHSMSAAAATAAICISLMLVRGACARWWLILVPIVALAVMLRTEALLLLGAWALILVAWGLARRRARTAGVGSGIAILVVAWRLIDQLWGAAVTGGGVSVTQEGSRAGSLDLASRIEAFKLSTIGPSPRGFDGTMILLLPAAAVLLFGAAILFRRDRRVAACVVAGGYLLAVLAALTVAPSRLAPGILLVFPLLVAALGLLTRSWFANDIRTALALAVALFAAAVFGTQYIDGGGVSWGARYLAVAVPVMAALAVDIVDSELSRADQRTGQIATGFLVCASLLVATLAVTSLGHVHRATERTVDPLMREAALVDPGDGGKPVIVTDSWALARLAWPDYENFRWVYRAEDQQGLWNRRLAAAGVRSYAEVREYGTPDVTVHRLD